MINANQSGDSTYAAATRVQQSFTVAKGDPALSSFGDVSKTFGNEPFALTAPSVGNTLPGAFSYSSATTATATIANSGGIGTVTIVGAGTTIITATFTPTDTTNYNTATITMTLTVGTATLDAVGTITGTARVGVQLTAGALTPSAATVDYQWQVADSASKSDEDWFNISGATSINFTPTVDQLGKFIRVLGIAT